jgi:hypothetical protein
MKSRIQPMASSYVFRKIDSELWHAARVKCLSDRVRLLDVVQGFLRNWISAAATRADAVYPHAEALESRPRAHHSSDLGVGKERSHG